MGAGERRGSGTSCYLFLEDEAQVYRLHLNRPNIRIGRDESNDIWISHESVLPQHVLVFERDGAHHIKVYRDAQVRLNQIFVTGIQRLYNGDKLLIGPREMLYVQDEGTAEHALGITILAPDDERTVIVQGAWLTNRTITRVGRGDADLTLSDRLVARRHAVIEHYCHDGLFLYDAGTEIGTSLNGERVGGRRRLRPGDLITIGSTVMRVSIHPITAYGLLDPDAPPTATEAPEHRLGRVVPAPHQIDHAPETAARRGFVRPHTSPNVVVPEQARPRAAARRDTDYAAPSAPDPEAPAPAAAGPQPPRRKPERKPEPAPAPQQLSAPQSSTPGYWEEDGDVNAWYLPGNRDDDPYAQSNVPYDPNARTDYSGKAFGWDTHAVSSQWYMPQKREHASEVEDDAAREVDPAAERRRQFRGALTQAIDPDQIARRKPPTPSERGIK